MLTITQSFLLVKGKSKYQPLLHYFPLARRTVLQAFHTRCFSPSRQHRLEFACPAFSPHFLGQAGLFHYLTAQWIWHALLLSFRIQVPNPQFSVVFLLNHLMMQKGITSDYTSKQRKMHSKNKNSFQDPKRK